MTEQKLERIVIDQLSSQLSSTQLSGTRFIGAWQDSGEDEGHGDIIITVKAQPRSYQTPTIPDAEIQFELNVLGRVEEDPSGARWLSCVDMVTGKLSRWQKRSDEYSSDFALQEFTPTGFSLNGGDVGYDDERTVKLFSETFTVYGITE